MNRLDAILSSWLWSTNYLHMVLRIWTTTRLATIDIGYFPISSNSTIFNQLASKNHSAEKVEGSFLTNRAITKSLPCPISNSLIIMIPSIVKFKKLIFLLVQSLRSTMARLQFSTTTKEHGGCLLQEFLMAVTITALLDLKLPQNSRINFGKSFIN